MRQYTTDFEKAKQLLAEAGYPDGGFTLELTYTSENSNEAAFTPLIKEAFAKVGVTVNIKALLNTADGRRRAETRRDRQDLAIQLWWPSYPDGFDNLEPDVRLRGRSGLQLVLLVQPGVRQARGRGVQAERHGSRRRRSCPTTRRRTCSSTRQSAAFLFDDQTVAAHLATIKYSDSAINFNYPQVQFWTQITK